jgi:hypothetical protein
MTGGGSRACHAAVIPQFTPPETVQKSKMSVLSKRRHRFTLHRKLATMPMSARLSTGAASLRERAEAQL